MVAEFPYRREAVPDSDHSGNASFSWLHSLGFDCNTEVCEASIMEASTERSEKNQVEVKMTVCCVHKNLPNALFDQ